MNGINVMQQKWEFSNGNFFCFGCTQVTSSQKRFGVYDKSAGNKNYGNFNVISELAIRRNDGKS